MPALNLEKVFTQQRPTIWRHLIGPYDAVKLTDELSQPSTVSHGIERRAVAIFRAGMLNYPNNLNEFTELYNQQKGYILQDADIDNIVIRNLKGLLSNRARTRTTIAAYISEKGHAVLPLHRDALPVLALQISGSKQFDLVNAERNKTEVILNPGDGLFIPAGLEHQTKTLENSSHLCVEFHP
ncbi:MAG TPA: cupin domain-containing protein [Candidatus Saccharimonadales bacterium]|jgi:cupin superfamily acireductone dioxygenase involved in methionine salvage